MLRVVKFTSVKVVRGDDVGSMAYPITGRYVFRYSISAAPGDYRGSKAYRAGMGLTNPLLPVSVVDGISSKTLPPTHSFCSLKQESVVVSTLKKSDENGSLLLRVHDIEGAGIDTGVTFLGATASFGEVNLLEEALPGVRKTLLQAGPHSIRTVELPLPASAR